MSDTITRNEKGEIYMGDTHVATMGGEAGFTLQPGRWRVKDKIIDWLAMMDGSPPLTDEGPPEMRVQEDTTASTGEESGAAELVVKMEKAVDAHKSEGENAPVNQTREWLNKWKRQHRQKK